MEEAPGGVYLRVRVQPRASKDRVDGVYGGALKVRLSSPPVEGAANKALVEFISKLLGVKKSSVFIDSGEKSKDKRVGVEGLSPREVDAALEDVLD